MKKLYFLQGIIFANGLIAGSSGEQSIGIAPKIKRAVRTGVFQAITGLEEDPENLSGYMNDYWGNSKVTNFKISDEELSFTKNYEDNSTVMNYLYNKKDGEVWLGEYTSTDCGNGTSKCIVVPIDENFLESVF